MMGLSSVLAIILGLCLMFTECLFQVFMFSCLLFQMPTYMSKVRAKPSVVEKSRQATRRHSSSIYVTLSSGRIHPRF